MGWLLLCAAIIAAESGCNIGFGGNTWKNLNVLVLIIKREEISLWGTWSKLTSEHCRKGWAGAVVNAKVLWVKTKKASYFFHHLYFVTWTRQINKRTHNSCSGHLYTVASDQCWNSLLGGCLARLPSAASGRRHCRARPRLSWLCRGPGSAHLGQRWHKQGKITDLVLSSREAGRGRIYIMQIKMHSASSAKFPL